MNISAGSKAIRLFSSSLEDTLVPAATAQLSLLCFSGSGLWALAPAPTVPVWITNWIPNTFSPHEMLFKVLTGSDILCCNDHSWYRQDSSVSKVTTAWTGRSVGHSWYRQDSSVSKVTTAWTGESADHSWYKQQILLCSKMPRWAPGTTHPPILS